jgi:transcriptional regulator with XRE-family HTH domain
MVSESLSFPIRHAGLKPALSGRCANSDITIRASCFQSPNWRNVPFPLRTAEEKRFSQEFGERMAALRKEQGLTQTQLAELLGVSQQQVASFEAGRRRVTVAMLPAVARALGVSVEELVGAKPENSKRGPTPKLQQQLERVSRLPKARQRFVIEMLDTVLAQASRPA